MPTSPAQLLDFASNLICTGGDETAIRTGISRVYYSAFHSVGEKFQSIRQSKANISVHKELIDEVTNYARTFSPGRTEASQIAKHLVRTRANRRIADYELSETVSQQDGLDTLQRVNQIVSLLGEFDRKVRNAAIADLTSPSKESVNKTTVEAMPPVATAAPSGRPALKRIR